MSNGFIFFSISQEKLTKWSSSATAKAFNFTFFHSNDEAHTQANNTKPNFALKLKVQCAFGLEESEEKKKNEIKCTFVLDFDERKWEKKRKRKWSEEIFFYFSLQHRPGDNLKSEVNMDVVHIKTATQTPTQNVSNWKIEKKSSPKPVEHTVVQWHTTRLLYFSHSTQHITHYKIASIDTLYIRFIPWWALIIIKKPSIELKKTRFNSIN